MKKTLLGILLLLFCTALMLTAAEDMFTVPLNIRYIGEEAFEDLDSEAVFIPQSVTAIGDGAFGKNVRCIYGHLGSAAQGYAERDGKDFVPVDVLDLKLEQSDLWIQQGMSVSLNCSAKTNIGKLLYRAAIEKDGAIIAESDENESGDFVFTITESGVYDVVISAQNGYDDCSVKYSEELTVAPEIRFSQAASLVDIGEKKELFDFNEDRQIEIVSYDGAVISIENGLVTGLKTGSTLVEARADCGDRRFVTGSFTITVCKPVTGITLSVSNAHLLPGEETVISATVKPTDAGKTALIWSSSDEETAVVDGQGHVRALLPGKTTIQAKANSGVTALLEIAVEIPESGIFLPEEASVGKGETLELEAYVLPEDAYIKTLTFMSTDASVATVANGKVKGVSLGECDIIAETNNGLAAVCHITVIKPVTSVRLPSSATVDLYAGHLLTATVQPSDATDQTLTWTSSDESIATVDETGLVTTLRSGTVTVSATSINGKSASCKITVKETKPTSVSFDELFITLHPGDEHALSATILPSIAQNKTLTFSSSDERVVIVDEDGLLHAVGTGNAVITGISASVPSLKTSCKVFVIREDALPLEGVVVGINPGHQKRGINTLYPISPGSSTMKVGCKVGTAGLNTKTPEYVVTLDVSFILRDILEENGATVIMTRTTNDAYLTNIERADILNSANVDAAIQVHCNGGASNAKGMSSYYRSTGSWVPESKWLAECMLEGMMNRTGATSIGMHVCNTYMSLNYSFTPACLVEMGYLTNPEEELLLIDPAYQRKLAEGMVQGLIKYVGRD